MIRNELLQQLLELSPAEKAEVCDAVISSMANDVTPELTADEHTELLRRVEEYRRNPSSFFSWEQVKALLAEQRSRKSA